MNALQLIIVSLLSFVLMFGMGFILNMLLKTTWLPIALYVLLIGGLFVYFGHGIQNVWSDVGEYGFADWLAIACGLGGAALSGWTIRTLREKGFRMF
ncbi:MAG: hypothetical protein KGO83_05370 [Paenibacillaceae bacterium]|nr:hypothetical protein [Paenibacillaceae bacterium]